MGAWYSTIYGLTNSFCLNFSRGSLNPTIQSIQIMRMRSHVCNMAALNEFEDFVREKIEVEKFTHKKLSEMLQQVFPGDRGFSVRSIKRFCNENSIRKTTSLDNQELDEVVAQAVTQVHFWCDATRPSISIHNLLVTKVILHFALAVEQAKEWLGGLGVGVDRKGGGARGILLGALSPRKKLESF